LTSFAVVKSFREGTLLSGEGGALQEKRNAWRDVENFFQKFNATDTSSRLSPG
jgi:hypothetical protein